MCMFVWFCMPTHTHGHHMLARVLVHFSWHLTRMAMTVATTGMVMTVRTTLTAILAATRMKTA